MSKNHLLQTPYGWYFRIAVPSDLRNHFNKREIKIPLNSQNRSDSTLKAKFLCCKAKILFNSLRGQTMAIDPTLSLINQMTLRRDFSPSGESTILDITAEELNALTPEARAHLLGVAKIHTPMHSVMPTTKNMLQEKIDEFIAEKERAGWKIKTAYAQKASLGLLIEYFGDVPMETITRKMAGQLIEDLKKIPTNRKKIAIYKDKTLKQLIAKNLKPEKCLDISTCNDHIKRYSTFFEWAHTQDRNLANPFSKQEISDDSSDNEKRDIFTVENLTTIFTHPIYTEHKYSNPSEYWVPIIAYYTGLRLEEICQLHIEDIKPDGYYYYFDINGKPPRSLKNKDSDRIIPIAEEMIKLGLLTYVEELKAKGEVQLFPNFKKTETTKFSHRYSQDFSKFLTNLGVKTDRKLVFHSFRHTFADSYKNIGYDEGIVGALMGHHHGIITYGRYAKNYKFKLLLEAIEQRNHNGFDLMNIVKPW